MAKDKKDDQIQVALNCELVGIKNLKSTHSWRIELDVYEMDSHKVKELFDLIDMPTSVAIVGSKTKKDIWDR
ncbi:MAG: hypothetical protein H8D23_17700 [Candidatus Brocadiales bacterium]|nr:hypothetical protein [Candidatus Brocadiales bacterium]